MPFKLALSCALPAALVSLVVHAGALQSAAASKWVINRGAVLDDSRMNLFWSAHVDRLVAWLGVNGFERLDGARLPDWVRAKVAGGDAYGSVVVLPRGVTPDGLVAGPRNHPLWLRYLEAGGRIVHCGDMPFNYVESPDVRPLPLSARSERSGLALLGIASDWSSPFWGRGDLPVQSTPEATAWGLELADGPTTGTSVASVTAAFHVYVGKTGEEGASDWFRNVRPDEPWSGLVKIRQYFDGNSDAALRDVWRAAHYAGEPISVPRLPGPPLEPAAAIRIESVAGGRSGRREFVRGERVTFEIRAAPPPIPAGGWPADPRARVRIELRREEKTAPLARTTAPLVSGAATLTLDTSPFGGGAYVLTGALEPAEGAATSGPTRFLFGIRDAAPDRFPFAILHSPSPAHVRSGLEFDDIARAGMDLLLGPPDVAMLDQVVRHRTRFILRAMPDRPAPGQELDAHPEYLRIGPDGRPNPSPWGGRPSVGISHPDVISRASQSMEAQVRAVAGLPSFLPFVLTNDDFSLQYGEDFAPHVLAAFRAETGSEPPRAIARPAHFGPVPEDHPNLIWARWTLRHVSGAFNRAERSGVTSGRADVRIGPIPGGAGVPIVQMEGFQQYPTFDFGARQFSLVSFYYYNEYWQPTLTSAYWLELARVDHRDLPEWTMPDAMTTAGYTRNNFFHALAARVQGLTYFAYAARNASSWPELTRLGDVARRVGQVQRALEPSERTIGLLSSFTGEVFDSGSAILQAYAFDALMQAHFAVEMVSEDEVKAGRGAPDEIIVCSRIRYLAQSVYDALASRAAAGGIVLLDSTVPFDIPGAHRINLDLGRGLEGAPSGGPFPDDYGHVERVEATRQALTPFASPQFESRDVRVVASPFRAGGISYTWFVNAQDAAENTLFRSILQSDSARKDLAGALVALAAAEAKPLAEASFATEVVYAHPKGVPYDLVAGGELPVRMMPDGRAALSVRSERFGGALVAWMPSRIDALTLDAAPSVIAGEIWHVAAHVSSGGEAAPGILPVDFVLRAPSGAVSAGSGIRVTQGGAAQFDWSSAATDASGDWTLEARDLASGRVARRTLRLEPAPDGAYANWPK